MNKRLMALGVFLLLQACTQIDNYMLGKDNTEKPAPLAPLTAKASFSQKWSVSVGQANKTRTYLKLKPVIRGNIIYTAYPNGMVQAIQKHTGKVIWSRQIDASIVSGPAIAKGVVAVGTNTAHVVLLNQADGQQLWKAQISSDSLSKPVIAGDTVFVKTIDGNVYAFHLKTGEKIWVVDHGSPSLILKASSSPIVMDKVLLVGFSDGKLDAIDTQFGHVLWQRSIVYASGSSDVERLIDIDADPIVRGNIVYLASYQGYIGALSLDNGQFIWNKPASTFQNIAIDATTVYMTDSDDILWAFDRQTGLVKWKQVQLKARGLSEPVLMGHCLVVGDKTGFVHLLSTQNGELIGRTQLNAAVEFSPAVSGDKVYVMTSDGKLNCLSVS